ncbi:MAG: hypothetical protein WAU75_12580 [Solirubrobacteraceae bacterium]
MLVGSLPASSTEEALRAGGELFGDLVFALPDGETGPRALWVAYDHLSLLDPHPQIDVLQPSARPPKHVLQTTVLGLPKGVDTLQFETWPRIDDAIASYRVFRSLREVGVIPAHVRFQVSLPFRTSTLIGFKAHFGHDFPIAAAAWEDLVARELVRLTSEIPPADLAIQWDVCWEVLDLEGVVAWTEDDAWERFTGPVSRVTRMIPEETLVGYHLCYGTFPSWPMYEARDMELLVKMANYAVENSGRPVDWLHLAGPKDLRSEDSRFFAPLAGLRVSDTRVYLGIVLPVDGADGLRRRHATASKYIDDFGVAMYCGFGRQPGTDGVETMREHRDVVEAVLGVSAGAGG